MKLLNRILSMLILSAIITTIFLQEWSVKTILFSWAVAIVFDRIIEWNTRNKQKPRYRIIRVNNADGREAKLQERWLFFWCDLIESALEESPIDFYQRCRRMLDFQVIQFKND